ncbi:MAG: hypothetical protein LBK95_06930 [Bifidobacteriaceae bacterium]|jgi:hypothetical protein|nr:hypothetical protein [Bifidobacteriaceae bacterium]
MQPLKALVRRIGVALLGLTLLGGLTVIGASAPAAASDCLLQRLVDTGGLVAVPAGCREDGPVMIKKNVELAGGPVEVTGGFVVGSGATLTVIDNTAVIGPVTVQDGGTLVATGSATSIDGTVWVQGGGTASFAGVGPIGVSVTDVTNQGLVQAGGLIKLGQPTRGIPVPTGRSARIDLTGLAVGAEIWFETPTEPVIAARLLEGSLSVGGPDSIKCDSGNCRVDTVASPTGDLWLQLTPSAGPASPSPSVPSASPEPSAAGPSAQPSTEPKPADIAEEVAQAPHEAVIELAAGAVVARTIVIADRRQSALTVTLTGGPIKRGLPGPLIQVPAGSTLTLRDIVIDGDWAGPTDAYAPVVEVAKGGRLFVAEGAKITSNRSFGIVNAGTLNVVGPDAAVTNCTVDAAALDLAVGPVGGAGVWNQAGGEFWMSGGAIANNTVTAGGAASAFGGGVLNAGAMRLAGGSITGNQVDGGGGGVAVVRQPGSDHGGRLDVGGYYLAVAGAELPNVRSNSAAFGGGVAVVDHAEWGGQATSVAQPQVPGDVPSAVLDRGVLDANQASGQGGAVMAYGGTSVGLDGPLSVLASNRAGAAGTDGVAVADAYLRVNGDVRTEAGGGIALLREGWPMVVGGGFTESGRLVIEQVEGLAAGGSLTAIRLDETVGAVSAAALGAITFAIDGLSVELVVGGDGQVVLRGQLTPDTPTVPDTPPSSGPSTPGVPSTGPSKPATPSSRPSTAAPTKAPTTGPTTRPSSVPSAPSSRPATPSRDPASPATQSGRPANPTRPGGGAASANPARGQAPATGGGRVASAVGGAGSSGAAGSSYYVEDGPGGSDDPGASESDGRSPSTGASAKASASSPASAAASQSGSPSGPGEAEAGPGGPNLSVPEPPPGASSRTIGFALMAIGIFGLAGLGMYVLRRGGFFAT